MCEYVSRCRSDNGIQVQSMEGEEVGVFVSDGFVCKC